MQCNMTPKAGFYMYFLVCCITSLPAVGGECVSACPGGCVSQVYLWAVWNLCNSHLLFPLTFTYHSQKSARMSDNPVKEEVENFNRRSLKKTETTVKQPLPTKEGECALILCSVPHPIHHCVKGHFWLLWSHCKCSPSYLSPFRFSFVIKTWEKKDLSWHMRNCILWPLLQERWHLDQEGYEVCTRKLLLGKEKRTVLYWFHGLYQIWSHLCVCVSFVTCRYGAREERAKRTEIECLCEASRHLSVLMLPAFPSSSSPEWHSSSLSVFLPGLPGSCPQRKLWLNKTQ